MAISTVPAIKRLEHWTLVTNDIERSKRFYTEVLGADAPERNPGGRGPVSVNLAGTVIDLFAPSEGQQPSPGGHGQHHAYIVGLEDFDPWVERLKEFGVPVDLTTHGQGRLSVFFDDPDGYHIELTVPFDDIDLARSEMEKRGLRPGR